MEEHLKIARHIAKLLDTNFNFFGKKIGYDGIVGLVPVLGDVVTFGYSFYLIWIGIKLGIPTPAVLRMIVNTIMDFVLGFVPILGDFADFFYKSNVKNFHILEKYANIMRAGTILEGEKA